MKKIVPHLWFDKEAKEAANFYTTVFDNSKVTSTRTISNTPSGDCDIVSFELRGQPFMAISAGPYFKFNPSISFMVNFDPSQDPDAKTKIDEAWARLSEGGKVLMPLATYPFSSRYGWIQDRYGISWQLILTNPDGERRPPIIPFLMFVKNVHGKAQEATDFYLSVFKNSERGVIARYGKGQEPEKEGTIMFTDFKLEDQWFAAMESAQAHDFNFNEAISFLVHADTQEEIDYYWERLSAVPEAEQCGWLKDKYGVSWQIIPRDMDEMMREGSPAQIERVTKAFLPMKKFDIATLRKAYEGEVS